VFDGAVLTQRSIYNAVITAIIEQIEKGAWLAAYSFQEDDVVFIPAQPALKDGFPFEDAWSSGMVHSFLLRRGPCAHCKHMATNTATEIEETDMISCALRESNFYKRWTSVPALAALGCELFDPETRASMQQGARFYRLNIITGEFERSGWLKLAALRCDDDCAFCFPEQ